MNNHVFASLHAFICIILQWPVLFYNFPKINSRTLGYQRWARRANDEVSHTIVLPVHRWTHTNIFMSGFVYEGTWACDFNWSLKILFNLLCFPIWHNVDVIHSKKRTLYIIILSIILVFLTKVKYMYIPMSYISLLSYTLLDVLISSAYWSISSENDLIPYWDI